MDSNINNFEARLSDALEQIKPGGERTVLLAAVSGGADSTAMLTGLAALANQQEKYSLHCLHVEHGIRPADESRGDAEAVLALCTRFDIPCKVFTIPQGKIAALAGKGGPGIEGAARYFRHKALRREARRLNADAILTAHTHDDLLENLLMRILRGSGPSGLAAMPRQRGLLFRPLLDMTRKELLVYMEKKNISYRIDSTNADINFLRNRVRHKLIPLLDEFFPSWRKSLLAMAETQSLTAEFLASEAGKRLPWLKENKNSLRLKENDFAEAPLILREEAIFLGFNILGCGNNTVPRRSALRYAAKQLATRDLGPIRFERQNGYITLKAARRSACQSLDEIGFSLLINKAGLYTLELKLFGLENNRILCIKADAGAQFPMVLRSHRDGDRISRGRHKRRFSDILRSATSLVCIAVITACNAEGPTAFIGITNDWDIIVEEASTENVFEVSWRG